MSPETQFAASIATIFAATLAAAISFIGLVIAKENKVSEFRQEWINCLRQEISDYLSSVRLATETILFANDHLDFEKKKEDVFETVSSYRLVINEKYCLIRLRLNPGEPRHCALLDAFSVLDRAIKKNKDGELNREDVVSAMDSLLKEAQKILKFEWERVKRGERWFFWTKYVVGAMVCILLVTSIGVYSQRVAAPTPTVVAPSSPNPAVQGVLRDKAAQHP